MNKSGFTLLEILIVLGIFGILAAFVSVNLLKGQNQASVGGAEDEIIADFKNQQLKAMTGNTGGQTAAQPFGIKFGNNSYTLFSGPSFSSNTGSFTVNLNSGLTITPNLPTNEVDFKIQTGEVANFLASQNSITISKDGSNEQKTIIFNKYGVITSN